MSDFEVGDRVRVCADPRRLGFEPAPFDRHGQVGMIEDAPGDYGVRFPGEPQLIYILGDHLELLPA